MEMALHCIVACVNRIICVFIDAFCFCMNCFFFKDFAALTAEPTLQDSKDLDLDLLLRCV